MEKEITITKDEAWFVRGILDYWQDGRDLEGEDYQTIIGLEKKLKEITN